MAAMRAKKPNNNITAEGGKEEEDMKDNKDTRSYAK